MNLNMCPRVEDTEQFDAYIAPTLKLAHKILIIVYLLATVMTLDLTEEQENK